MVIKSKDYRIKEGAITLALISDSKSHAWLEDLRREYPNKIEGIINRHLDAIMDEVCSRRYEWDKK